MKTEFKAGYVAIVGEPNVGKSTLVNAILQQKISIVTNKPQTTRQRVLGIRTIEGAQIIFLDTPGLIVPKYLLQQEMVKHAEAALAEADIIAVLVDLKKDARLPEEVTERISMYADQKPVVIILNKSDAVEKSVILPTLGLGVEYHPATRFRLEAKASGFGIIHHGVIWDAEGAAVLRIGKIEAMAGARILHYKTSPKSEEYFSQTLGGPYVGLRWVFR